MGLLNVLTASWDGKVGKTVGAKWKSLKTIRTYAKPSNPKTEGQLKVRGVFAQMTSFTSLVTDQIKYYTSLDVRSQSVRNAIIQANKAQIDAGTFDKATLIMNKGGLPNVTAFTVTSPAAGASVSATFTKPVATNITSRAKIVAVAIDEDNRIGGVGVAPLADEAVEIAVNAISGATLEIYFWVIDYRGSARVGSYSGHATATVA